jgi:hypothetical protein
LIRYKIGDRSAVSGFGDAIRFASQIS